MTEAQTTYTLHGKSINTIKKITDSRKMEQIGTKWLAIQPFLSVQEDIPVSLWFHSFKEKAKVHTNEGITFNHTDAHWSEGAGN